MTRIVVSVLVTVLLTSTGSATPTEDPHCKDTSNRCHTYAKSGFCAKESSMYTFMSIHCQRTCNVCPPCKDKLKICPTYAKMGYCSMGHNMFPFMFRSCPQTCNRCGDSERSDQHETTSLPPPRTVESMSCFCIEINSNTLITYSFYIKESSMYTFMSIQCQRTCNVCPPCKDKLKICPTYAKKGYCYMGHNMFPFMFRSCPQTCNRCGDSERPHQHETTSLPPPRTVESDGDSQPPQQQETTSLPPPRTDENPHCKDKSNRCQAHAKKGFCAKESSMYTFMSIQCQRTCNVCPPCKDKLKICPTYAKKGYCYMGHNMFPFMFRSCPQTCNRCGDSERSHQHETTSLPPPRTVENLVIPECVYVETLNVLINMRQHLFLHHEQLKVTETLNLLSNKKQHLSLRHELMKVVRIGNLVDDVSRCPDGE
ncbi:uncharacterized protein [Haliotis cracherodii]|uniref:uncharacterized protein n=1 Tax=Haliotis cracherodii TaxID=6455 RepID=UPI0039E9F028